MVEIEHLRKVYYLGEEKVVALDDVSLTIERGEVCCILGTSGSGKSTLLNMMAGLEKPTRGIIRVAGKRVDKMNEIQLADFRQSKIGFIFQSYNLLNSLTAVENVSMPLVFRGISLSVRTKRAKEMLAAVGLEKHLQHKPTQMSGGQQQRVGIARAFVSNPPIVFADEPTGNLDSVTTLEVMRLMLKIAKDYEQTLVIVTHDQEIADFADKVIHVRDGNVEKVEKLTKERVNE